MSLERQFTSLGLWIHDHIKDSLLVDLVKRHGGRILELKMHYNSSTSRHMLTIFRGMPELEDLEFHYVKRLADLPSADSNPDKVTLRKLKKLYFTGHSDFVQLIHAPMLVEIKIEESLKSEDIADPETNLKYLEMLLKASPKLKSVEMDLDVFDKMDPDHFPFQLKNIIGNCENEFTDNIKKFLLSQAATVEKLEVECGDSEFLEIVLRKFERLRTLKTEFKNLKVSEDFRRNLKPMPWLTELETTSDFSSASAIQAVLENCPNLLKLKCSLGREFPRYLEMIADNIQKLEVLSIQTYGKTNAKFKCLRELYLSDTATYTHDLLAFLNSNPTIETLGIDFLYPNDLDADGARSLITTTKLKLLKISGYMSNVKFVYDGIKKEFAQSETVKLSLTSGVMNSATLQAEINRSYLNKKEIKEATGETEVTAAKRKEAISPELLPPKSKKSKK